jgi:hypothetical protein
VFIEYMKQVEPDVPGSHTMFGTGVWLSIVWPLLAVNQGPWRPFLTRMWPWPLVMSSM